MRLIKTHAIIYIMVNLPFQNNKPQQPPTPLEQRKKAVEQQQGQIDKEFKRRVFIEKYTRSLVLAGVLVVFFLFGLWGYSTNFELLRSIFQGEDPTPPVIVDGPGDDFKIVAENATLVQNPDKVSYDVFARMNNTDLEWGVSELEYTINLLDGAGQVLGTRIGKTYILPRSQKALAEINVPAATQPVSVSIDFKPVKVQKLRDFGTIDFAVTNVRYFELNNRGRVTGTFTNNSPFGFDTIDVVVVLFDRQQNIVGINKTVIGQVLPSQQRDFTVIWPEYLGQGIQVVVEPSVDVFNSSNFLDIFSETQELDF